MTDKPEIPLNILNHQKTEIRTHLSYSNFTTTYTVRADPERKSKFLETCKLRGVSECHVADALFEAWIEGQKATATVIKPVVVNLYMEHIVQRPRRMIDAWEPKKMLWPPNCEFANKFFTGDKSIGCLQSRSVVSIKKCYECFRENNSR